MEWRRMSAGQGYLILDKTFSEILFLSWIFQWLSLCMKLLIIFLESKFVKQEFICECNSPFRNYKIQTMMSNFGSVSVAKFLREYFVQLFHEKSNYGKYTI